MLWLFDISYLFFKPLDPDPKHCGSYLYIAIVFTSYSHNRKLIRHKMFNKYSIQIPQNWGLISELYCTPYDKFEDCTVSRTCLVSIYSTNPLVHLLERKNPFTIVSISFRRNKPFINISYFVHYLTPNNLEKRKLERLNLGGHIERHKTYRSFERDTI